MDFYTTFQAGWFNAWIPALAMVIVQLLFMVIYKEGAKRAVDTSWYNKRDKISGFGSTVFQILLLIVAVFVPLKTGTAWFWTGAAIYAVSFLLFVSSFYSYKKAPRDKIIHNGVYRLSRNPMYFLFTVGMIGVCIAAASLWLLIVLAPFVVFMHFIILGEERYCAETYGEEYLKYKRKVRRYI